MLKSKHILIASYIPGRIRFKINYLNNNYKLSDYFRKSLEQIKEIHDVEINTCSQSLLIKYDNKELDVNGVYSIIKSIIKQYKNLLSAEKESMKYVAISSDNSIKINKLNMANGKIKKQCGFTGEANKLV
jgi:hypothetical protein